MSKFFMVGAATAAHQVEGNNTNSDFWAMEHMQYSSFTEPSLIACDHYNRYEEDIALLANAGLNAYRFSIEWARIEPEEGKFCEEEVTHYVKVLETCKKYNVTPIVTLYHFSSPKWLTALGGWENAATADYFARYCKYVVTRLSGYLGYVCTINEANLGIEIASLAREMQEKSSAGGLQVGINLEDAIKTAKLAAEENIRIFGTPSPNTFLSARTESGDKIIIDAHLKAKKIIKQINPDIKVGITLSLHDIQAEEGGEAQAQRLWQEEFTHYIPYIKDDDFIGVQNYTRTVVGKNGTVTPDKNLTQMGYEIYPEAIGNVVNRVHSQLDLPIIITENGIATADDAVRCDFINRAAMGVKSNISAGVPVLGYFYWSLMDNFEWQQGYKMQFGLVAVDRQTMERQPKDSLYMLKDAFN